MKAIWNGRVLAESENTIVIEGNHYFPSNSINKEFFQESDTNTICPWKGTASYFDVKVNGDVNADAAWYYPKVSELAKGIEGRIAFWRGVEIIK
ncbi:MAG: DUF427 domain-containing protein [Cyclobacteriaceae bacterium]|nr:DUF427 domain-containing protein [Cyclobacteriaceae bacterium]